ncbi:cupin domain-containing protein [Colletotrichum graminicola]|uniref:Cupin domain-containing protein n=1 Tax=Colletotrichum graminicola (strain M1.001 / M2 / FGSC 10212) TaxID=645133 RepID=E3QDF0_COLGM|nr:cupin domain-containing protein [Colletotrichum graminicola M1.001]EFQ28922.1 cupin domain-containing protein [Colletotrichum graminicola M1.001]WDK19105.1 cupin domain-containing protein [Colletotrichum graminicola]
MSSSGAVPAPEELPLGPVRRHITTHDANGRAVYSDAFPLEVTPDPLPNMLFHTCYTTSESPVRMNDDKDLAEYGPHHPRMPTLHLPSGSVLRVVDFGPHTEPMMHRTESCDYGIVLKGEVECHLDDGAVRTLGEGDIMIQRGTMHGWKNATDKWARVVFCLQPAEPVRVAGQVMEDDIPFMKLAPERQADFEKFKEETKKKAGKSD